MSEGVNTRDVLRGGGSFGAAEIDVLEAAVAGPHSAEVRQELASMKAEIDAGKGNDDLAFRAGVAAYILGQHDLAVRLLERLTKNGLAQYYCAISLTALERPQDAHNAFEQAAKSGYDKVECTLRKAGSVRQMGETDEAEKILRSVAKEGASRAEYSYQMGCILSDRGDSFGAIEYFERSVDMDNHHSRALFRLAAEHSLRGNDDDAIRLYEQSLSKPPFYAGALLNLGLLYEDGENYPAAAYCFRQVLSVNPNHERAQLYLKDIEATSDMYYDEESARESARLEQLLNRPVTDFELSVRSRNCLQNMNIFTLGDLTRITEQELLGGKNFGETSLHEIRDLLGSHGLMIGQNLHKKREPAFSQPATNLSPQEQAVLNMPISDLNLSVRARKCMSRLGITSVGELLQKTQDELLSTRNFGVTSLNEIRAKLSEHDLKLRND